jgi:hypothetical protein
MDDGSFTSLADEVGEVFVRFYLELLGTPKTIIPIDFEVAHSGPYLDDSSHSLLLALVSNDDIKEVHSSIANEKARDLMVTPFSLKNHGLLLRMIFVLLLNISLPMGNS